MRLVENNIQALFISSQDIDQYNQYIEKNLGHIVDNTLMGIEEKSQIIYHAARQLMQRTFEKPDVPANIQRSHNFVKETVRFVLQEENCFSNIINLTTHDYYTFTHCVHVCVYSLALARAIGVISPYQLQRIGMGALLHDIGKCNIPYEILTKNGALDDYEWSLMKEHPQNGVEILKKHQGLHADVYDIVKYHHEKLDGSGYPDGLTDQDIPRFAKLVCVADIFDALNTKRSYRDAENTFHSLQIMENEFKDKIDSELLRTFIILFSHKK